MREFSRPNSGLVVFHALRKGACDAHVLLESARDEFEGPRLLQFFAIAAGAIGGGLIGGGFGALTGAALAWLAWLLQQQARAITALRRDLALTRQQAQAPGASTPANQAPALPASRTPAAAAATTAGPAPTPNTPAQAAAPAETQWSDEAHDTDMGSLWGDTTVPIENETAKPGPRDRLAPIWKWLRGGNTVVKLGVAILFVGLTFLAKFAAEHVRVPIELRLGGLAAVALALLGLGWRLRQQRPGYARILQGGAVAVLYLTLFVAFRFYDVLALGPALACMVVLAALAAALAVLQDARALAVIGALGGFATPLLVSTGGGSYVALFGYCLVLDLGIAAVAWHKNWPLLNRIGFFGTFLVGSTWGVLNYRSDHYASTQAFLIAYFLLFTAILLMPARPGLRQDRDAKAGAAGVAVAQRSETWVNGSLLFGLPTLGFALQHALVRHLEYGTALSALVLAMFYVGLALWMRPRPVLAVTFEASLALAIVFLSLVIPFALDAHSTAGAWALEGAGLVWLGQRQQRLGPRLFGYLLLFVAGLAMISAYGRHAIPTAFFNARLINGLMAAAASLAAAHFVRSFGVFTPANVNRAASSAQHEAVAEPLLIAWGTLWLLLTTASQVRHFTAPGFELTAWLVCISAIAVVYTLLSQRLDWQRIAWPVLGHAPLLALCVAVSALVQSAPSQGGGWWAWPLALAAHAFVLRRAASRWRAQAPIAEPAVHALGLLLLAALGALQGRAITRDWGDAATAWAWLGWLVVPAALLMLLRRPDVAARWPVRAAPVAYRTHAAALLAAGLLLWTLLANVMSNGAAAPLPHLPLLNPLDLGIGFALLAAWLWMRSALAQPLLALHPRLALQVTAGAGFVWLNAILIRAFYHYGGVPFHFRAWIESLAVQTGISLLWSATALVLMWLAARRRSRPQWMVGAVLLGAVVLKLVLVDLWGIGTVTRIVSCIGVGVLMLVIGYVAPPPDAVARKAPRAGA